MWRCSTCVDCCRHVAETGKCCSMFYFLTGSHSFMSDLAAVFGVIVISKNKELGALEQAPKQS